MASNKEIGLAAGAGVILVGTSVFMHYHDLDKSLNFSTHTEVHAFHPEDLEVSLEILIKNPTSHTVRLNHPFIMLHHQGREIVSSQMRKTVYTLREESQLKLAPVSFMIPYSTLLEEAPSVYAELRNNAKIPLTAEVTTKMDWLLPIKRQLDVVFDVSVLSVFKKFF